MAFPKKQIGENFLNSLEKEGFSLQEDFFYKNSKQKVLIKHNKCGTIFPVSISHFVYRSQRCANKECKLEKSKQSQLKKFGVENASMLPETTEKRKQTCLSKFGVESFSQTQEFLDKNKQTCLNKFGVESFSQTQEFLDKTRNTCLERFGKEHYSLTDEFLEKSKKTSLEKFGVENVSMLPETTEKRKKTFLTKYGVENASQLPEIIEKIKKTCTGRYGFSSPMKNQFVKDKVSKIIRDNFYEEKISFYEEKYKIKPLFTKNEYFGVHDNSYDFECLVCSSVFNQRIDGSCSVPRCPKCFPQNRSKAEQEIADFISNLCFVEPNKRFYDEKNTKKWVELDVFIPSKKIGFEYDGLYYHTEIGGGKDKNYHINKNSFLEKRGVQVFHIWENEWRENREIVKSIIKNKLGLTSNKLFARKLTIKEVPKKETKSFLLQNHIQGFAPSKWNYGLYGEGELKCLLTIDKPRFDAECEYEIIRFCSLLDTNVIGGFSRLLNYFKKIVKPKSIITYADKRYSNGNVYEKNGFSLSHSSSPNYFYTKNYIELLSRHKFQKHKLKDLLESYDPNKTEWENMKENGYDRIWDLGNYVFKWEHN